jgi:hypothetical protein
MKKLVTHYEQKRQSLNRHPAKLSISVIHDVHYLGIATQKIREGLGELLDLRGYRLASLLSPVMELVHFIFSCRKVLSHQALQTCDTLVDIVALDYLVNSFQVPLVETLSDALPEFALV